jgi:hypothetical protein
MNKNLGSSWIPKYLKKIEHSNKNSGYRLGLRGAAFGAIVCHKISSDGI